MRRRLAVLTFLALLILGGFLACSTPSEPPPAPSGMNSSDIVIPPPPADSGLGAMGLVWQTPTGWTEQTPATSMRKAQYLIEGPGGPARCDVFYFGPGQGGDPDANIQRWAHQFVQEEGANPLENFAVTELTGAELPTRVLEITGSYRNSMGSGPAQAVPGTMLLGAIVEGPDAPWFFKLTGPEQTVAPQREEFHQMLRTVRTGG